MTPYSAEYETETAREQTTRTYRVDFERGRISGFADGVSAMEQAVLLILSTERFKHVIYSWDYGSEVNATLGEDFQLAMSEVKRFVVEALEQDERITGVDGFEFTRAGRNTMNVSFTVHTIYGDISEQIEVST